MVTEICNENWSTFDLLSFSSILVKVMLFQLSGHGQAEDNARPNFSPDSKSLLLGLSNGISSICFRFFGGMGKKYKMSEQNPRGAETKFPQCSCM